MYKYLINHLPKVIKGELNIKRPSLPLDWEFITLHNTGNPKSNALGERNWLENPTNKTSTGYHLVIDEKYAIECLPLNENGWHAGDGYNGWGNRRSLGIEIVESGDYKKTIENTIDVVAKLLLTKMKKVSVIRPHQFWSKKNCPRLILAGHLGITWDILIKRIDDRLTQLKKEAEEEKVQEKEVENLVPKWKTSGIELLHKEGILKDPEGWIEKIEEPMPTWAVTILLANMYKKLKG